MGEKSDIMFAQVVSKLSMASHCLSLLVIDLSTWCASWRNFRPFIYLIIPQQLRLSVR
jgi:hypothetical protein